MEHFVTDGGPEVHRKKKIFHKGSVPTQMVIQNLDSKCGDRPLYQKFYDDSIFLSGYLYLLLTAGAELLRSFLL